MYVSLIIMLFLNEDQQICANQEQNWFGERYYILAITVGHLGSGPL